MTDICIAAAQSSSVPGNIEANIQNHVRFIAAARSAQVDVLVFPELSLSGYELPLLRACALTPNDARLAPLQAAATEAGMTVIVGLPLADPYGRLPFIGALLLLPDGDMGIYCKQHLHAGEEQHVRAGAIDTHSYRRNGHDFAMAICADTSHREHAAAAAAAGAGLYLASVLESEGGYAKDASLLQQYAADFRMGVLLANHGGPTGGYLSPGKSAFWNPQGELVVAADGPGDCLVVARHRQDGWSGEVLQ